MHTTVREANDRGFECAVLSDCVGSYVPEFQRVGMEMLCAQGGIFGWVAGSASLLSALDSSHLGASAGVEGLGDAVQPGVVTGPMQSADAITAIPPMAAANKLARC